MRPGGSARSAYPRGPDAYSGRAETNRPSHAAVTHTPGSLPVFAGGGGLWCSPIARVTGASGREGGARGVHTGARGPVAPHHGADARAAARRRRARAALDCGEVPTVLP